MSKALANPRKSVYNTNRKELPETAALKSKIVINRWVWTLGRFISFLWLCMLHIRH